MAPSSLWNQCQTMLFSPRLQTVHRAAQKVSRCQIIDISYKVALQFANEIYFCRIKPSNKHYSMITDEHVRSPVQLRGTFYRIVSVIQYWVLIGLSERNYSKRNYLRAIKPIIHKLLSAVEMLRNSALRMYKFTMDNDRYIDTDIYKYSVREVISCDANYSVWASSCHTSKINHGLYGSTSCCISHGPSQWERAIFDPPQLGDPSTDFHETW